MWYEGVSLGCRWYCWTTHYSVSDVSKLLNVSLWVRITHFWRNCQSIRLQDCIRPLVPVRLYPVKSTHEVYESMCMSCEVGNLDQIYTRQVPGWRYQNGWLWKPLAHYDNHIYITNRLTSTVILWRSLDVVCVKMTKKTLVVYIHVVTSHTWYVIRQRTISMHRVTP